MSSDERNELNPARRGVGGRTSEVTSAFPEYGPDRSNRFPRIVPAALDKLDLPAGEVAMLGHTPYDIEATSGTGG
jgi:hypothetical protein